MQKKGRTIDVDVDDTLIRTIGSKRVPMPGAIQAVRRMRENGDQLYLWSSGGGEYARHTAIELQLEDCFVAFLPKPDVYVDDQAVQDWRYCRHVLPANAAEA